MRRNKMETMDMVQGPLVKNIWVFAIPLMLTNFLQILFNAVDTIVVGKFAGEIDSQGARKDQKRHADPGEQGGEDTGVGRFDRFGFDQQIAGSGEQDEYDDVFEHDQEGAHLISSFLRIQSRVIGTIGY